MQPFSYLRADDLARATEAAAADGAAILAGGTTMVDLMKLGVRRPTRLVDITGLGMDRIEEADDHFRLGSLVTMAGMAGHETLKRDYPVLTESLWLAASPQLRNVASLGGNVLQRTRCPYFRDTSFACNKREPGSGCPAVGGVNRLHAVLGTSDACIAMYPSDWAQGLVALDTTVEIEGPDGPREIGFEALHLKPGDHPERETVLRPGEIVTAFRVAKTAMGKGSTYYKVRDRESYAFANASAAVAVAMEGDAVSDARIALGGVATVPWRSREAEDAIRGEALTPETARRAGEAAFEGAWTFEHNAFKVPLGIETVIEALMVAKTRAQA